MVHRAIFVVRYFESFSFKKVSEILEVFGYGFSLDLSIAAYITSVFAILYVFTLFIRPIYLPQVYKIFTSIIMFFVSLMTTVDLALYAHWEYRINATVLTYADTPSLMFASSSTVSILGSLVFFLALFTLSLIAFFKFIQTPKKKYKPTLRALVMIISFPLLIIMMRGGLQTIPINVSAAYHSNIQIRNHASVNPIWNFVHSVLKQNSNESSYSFLSSKEEKKTIEHYANTKVSRTRVIKPNPNILIIVWESLTSKITEEFADRETVPFLNSLRSESIYFSNFYANGTRSDKGLVSIFSGYYPQAMKSIMKETQKAKTLPSLFTELKKDDYECSFYYGGDTNFGNMQSYLLEGGVDEVIDGSHFDNKDKTSKWGAYDHVVFEKLFADIDSDKDKFCKSLFTITSHEPFEIPVEYKFGNEDELQKFRSAHHYTDSSLQTFIERAKNQNWWNNTLIIILADHGHPLPRTGNMYIHPDRFKIPMIWTGGALILKDTVINKVCSQVDVSYTLLEQLGVPNDRFTFSRDIFAPADHDYAHYIYTNGFGTTTNNGCVVYDMYKNKRIYGEGNHSYVDSLENLGKAITQNAYNDYLLR